VTEAAEAKLNDILANTLKSLERVATVEKPSESSMREERARRVRALLSECGLGLLSEDIERVASGKIEPVKAAVATREWVLTKPRPWLVLCGGTGVGKTVSAAWFLCQLYRERLTSEWPPSRMMSADDIERVLGSMPRALRAPHLAMRLRPWSHERNPADDPNPLRYAVLDDLGTERIDDPRFMEALADFVEARLDLPTLVTTNQPRKNIRKRYGDRIADRWNHIARVIEINDRSMRRKGDGL
jgi:DNA replication protein DnaC